jgi:hypothetical protein
MDGKVPTSQVQFPRVDALLGATSKVPSPGLLVQNRIAIGNPALEVGTARMFVYEFRLTPSPLTGHTFVSSRSLFATGRYSIPPLIDWVCAGKEKSNVPRD